MRIALLALVLFAQEHASEIRLLVRADDMGVALGVNEACIRSCKDGIARSVEVIVPGPWFLDAVKRLQENPDIDVGIHLCLTSEWDHVKWRPLTAAPSLVDKDGYFPATTRGFLDAKPRPEEIERELRAQIETLKRHVPRLSHASAHMGAATSTPDVRAVSEKLCREFGLRLEAKGTKALRGWSGKEKSAEQKEAELAAAIEKLEPGTWLTIEHPGTDSEEMRAIGHKGYENVAADRAGVTHALTSDRVKAAIKTRGVKLISHLELPREEAAGYSISAKFLKKGMASDFQGKALATVDRDANWFIEFEVLKVVSGASPVPVGERIAYLIHSPSRTLVNDPAVGTTLTISGAIERDQQGNTRHRIEVRDSGK